MVLASAGPPLTAPHSTNDPTGGAAMAVDLGDVVTLTWAYGLATTAVVTVTLPDGSTATPAVTGSTSFTASYPTTQAGRHVAAWIGTGSNPGAYTDVFDVEDAAIAAQSVVSLADVKAHLGTQQAGTDDRLRQMAVLATEVAENYTGRTWRAQSVQEAFNGGQIGVTLRHTPVTAITSVTQLGLPVTQYVLDTVAGVLYRGTIFARLPWLPGVQNIVVTYTTGETKVPASIRYAVLELVRHLWDTNRGGYSIPKQQGMGDDWDPRQGYMIPRRVSEMLDPYRAPGF